MSFRYMRMLLFYDLPTTSSAERKIAADFRKDIIKEGFIMLQESVYSKLVLNDTVLKCARDRVSKLKPPAGSVMLLTVTEKQFNSIELLLGDVKSGGAVSNTERLIVL